MDKRATEFAASEAKARFSELLDRAEAGEELTIRRHGKVVARLTPAHGGGSKDGYAARLERHEAFLRWRKVNVTPASEPIDYKALINEGRRF